ncbi:MAG TPA: aspartyl protease family protein [Novosphingobium sp.]|nr:aspartyl protease family protein [Novosphingobium sp.]
MSLALAMLIANPVILGTTPVPIAGAESAAGDTVQGRADDYARMTIEVAVHGIGPYRFLIDTGSQRTVVSTALAGRLGLVGGAQVRVMGIAGTHEVATAQVDSIDIGPRSFYDLTVPLLEGENIGADGILGTDSLQHQRVLLDFARNTIRIGDASELGGRRGFEIVVEARRKSGRLILTDAKIDGVHVDVVIDTGASGSVGNLALQKALAHRARPPALLRGTLSSVTGHDLPVEIGIANKLELAGIGVNNVLIAYADAPAFGELKLDKRPAIFLGMRELRAFKRVAIDFSTRKVLLDIGNHD